MGVAAGIALQLNFIKEITASHATFAPSTSDIVMEVVRRTGRYRFRTPGGRRCRLKPLSNCPPIESNLLRDDTERLAGIPQTLDPLMRVLP